MIKLESFNPPTFGEGHDPATKAAWERFVGQQSAELRPYAYHPIFVYGFCNGYLEAKGDHLKAIVNYHWSVRVARAATWFCVGGAAVSFLIKWIAWCLT